MVSCDSTAVVEGFITTLQIVIIQHVALSQNFSIHSYTLIVAYNVQYATNRVALHTDKREPPKIEKEALIETAANCKLHL